MKKLEQQFIAAHEQYSTALFHYCASKLSNREVAKDVIQETFFRAWRYISEGKTIDNMKAFLYKILGNLIIDEYRKRVPVDSLDRMCEEGFDAGFDDTDRWFDSIDGKRALVLLGEVREPYRDMLFMRYMKGLSIPEIVEKADVSKNTVAVRLHRGLHILHDLFTEQAIAA